MQNQNKLSTRILSLALSAAMALTSFPVAAFAVEGDTPPHEPSGTVTTTHTITAFGELGEGFEKSVPFDGHTYVLNVNANTPFAEVKLPTELSVTVEKATTTTPPAKDEPVAEPTAEPVAEPTAEPVAEPVAEPTAEPVAEPVAEPTAEPKQENTIVIETTQENLAVTWKGDKEYTAAENSTVVYTPVLPEGYALKDGVILPTINVMVGKPAIVQIAPMAATPRATVTKRTTPLDLATNADITYAATDGKSKTANPTTTSITDTTEGWSWDSTSKTLTLSGANIDCSGSTASGEVFGIQLSTGCKIVLANGTTSTVKAGASSNFKSSGVLFTGVSGSHSISGAGTLNATGGDATDTNASFGIMCQGTLTISDATIVAISGTSGTSGNGIYANALDVKSGNITANGTGTTNGYGISITNMTMSGGTVMATGSGSSNMVFGIKGTTLNMTGGTLSASAPGKTAVRIENTATATGANVTGTNSSFTNGSSALLTQSGAGPVVFSFPKPVAEQFSLPLGGTYYFDLSSEVGNVGTINTAVPDITLHYVPFTYAGTVNAYSLDSTSSGKTDASANAVPSERSLFVSDYIISGTINWNGLNTANLIFGKNFDTNYTLRSLSTGSRKTNGIGLPITNEWDSILKKSGLTNPIKNWNGLYSWGQDTSGLSDTKRSIRGGTGSAANWNNYASNTTDASLGLRPALEVLSPTTLTADGLKAVVLDLNGGTFNSANSINIVCAGGTFKAPSNEGLTRPSGNTGTDFNWNTAQDGKGASYAVGASVPNSVTTLYAQWTAPAKPAIIEVDGTNKTLQAAINEAAEGDTLKLTKNIDLGDKSATVLKTKAANFTIDLNGFKLTSSGTTIIHNGAGTLTIDDGRFNIGGGTSGIVQTTSTRPGDYAIQNGGAGTVSVVKGTVHAIGVIAIGSTGTGAISVSGGTVSSDKSNAIYSRSTGTITVSGGTVSSNIGNAISNTKTGTINISGGKVSSNSGSAIWNDSTGAITVSGTAELTSACTDERLGTIFLPTSTAGQEILKISGNAVVKHTGDGSINKSAIRTDGAGTVSIIGGTVSSNACSAIFNYGTGTINVRDCTVSTTAGTAIRNVSTGTINVSSSAVSTTTGDAIWNSGIGAINVRDGIVSATTGTAIKNSKTGVITVGGTAEVTSQNTAWNGGTIYFGEVPTTGVILKVEDKAQVTNTAAEEGYSAFFYPLNLTPVTVKNYYTVAEGAKLGKVYPMPPKIISFDARNGDTINDVRINASMQLPSNPSRWGYDFGGWYDGIDGTDAPEGLVGELTLEKAKALSAGIKVYAKWTKDGKTLRTTPLDLTGAVTAAPDQGWTWDVDKKILTLNGATIMSENSIGSTGSSKIELYAVKLPTGATITLAEGSKSDIIGGNCISSDAVDIRSCGIYVNDATSGILTINGTGTLNTRGGGVFYNQAGESCGIFSADKINIVSGTVNATGGTVVSTYKNTDTFSSSIGISTDQLSAVAIAIAIGKDATVNATGGEATYTCKNGPSDGFAMSDGISSTENISNDGKLTAVGDIAICNGADGKRISDNEKSYGTLSDTATFSATAVTSVKGKTAAISTINGITASKAFIIGANETSFTSGVTKTLTQADQTVPVEIVFTKVVTFDARNGAATTKVETDGDTIIMPSNPKWGDNAAKDNYTFAGWYTGIDGAGEAFVNENLAVRTTVYAKWTKDGKTVRTEALDLSTATASIDKLAAEGWSWDSSSSTLTLNGAIIMGENSVGAIGTGAIELYAVKLPPVATINLVEGSESNLIGGNCTGSNASNIKSCGIYANEYSDVNTLTINGTGTLNTRGGDILNNQNGESCGIFTVGEINIVSGTVNTTGGAVVSKSDYPNSSSKGIQLDGKFEIGEKATVNAIGGKASSTCTSDYNYGMATSYGIYNDYEISNKGNLTVVGDTAIFEDKNGNPVIDKQTSHGIESDMITCISPAVILAKGETIAIYTYTGITAEGASVTNGTADNAGGKFESGTTTALTQTDTTKPVKISFGPSIAVAAQSGKATYGTVASPTFAVTGSSFGGNYPAFAPSVVWTSGSAPKGVTTTFTGTNSETLTVKTTADTPADTYKFKVVSAKIGGGNYESAEVALKVDKLTATITWTGTSLTYNGKEQAPTATVSNKIDNDDVTVTVTGGKTNVGTDITATANTFEGTAAANYAMPSTAPTTSFTITAKKVTVNDGNLEVKKAFDGKNDAGTVTGGKLGLTDVVGTDDVSVKVDTVGVYSDSNVGKNKTVALTISLEGATASNYTLGSANTYEFKKAEITKVAYSGAKANAPDGTPKNKGDKSITIKPVTPPDSEKVEYAVSKTNTAPTLDSDWQDGTTFNNLNPNTTYYFFARVTESDNHAPGGESTGTSITTNKSEYTGKPTKPDETPNSKSDISITLKAVTPPDGETVEYGIDTNNDGNITWQISPTFSPLSPNTEYKFYIRVKENDTHKAGAASDVTKIKTDKVAYAGTEATAPNASKTSKTDTTVTLEAQIPPLNETIEYGYSDSATGTITWKGSNAFTGLSANTEYFFFARVKENDKHMAGATSASITIKTDKVAYTGTQSTAPNKIADKKTDISITLKAVTPPDDEAVEYGIDKNNDGTITWQTGFTFDNLAPDTEYKFYTRVKESDTHKAGTASAATTIKTKKVRTTVSGTVKDSGGNSLTGATITLTPSSPLITTTTDANGKYTINNVPEGAYSLVVKNGDITITDKIDVAGKPITGRDMQFLDGDKNTVVEATPNAPEVAVGGMNDLLDSSNIDATLTPEEKKAVDANGSVELKFTADLKAAAEGTIDKSELEAIAGNQKIDLLLDLSVLKTVKDSSGNTVTNGEKITTLADIIEIRISIPAHLQSKAGLSLYRMHDGKPEKLSTKPDANGEYYIIDPSGEFMTVYVKNFSTYALGYNAFTVTIQNGGTGASGNGNYSSGDTVTINAGTKNDYSFNGWTVTAGTVTLANQSSASTTFTMPAENVTVTAGWTYTGSGNPGGNGSSSDTYYYIKATAGIGGSMSTSERVKVRVGESAGFTIIPDKGYQVADVQVNGKSIGAKNYYAFTNVLSDQTIHATFKKAGHANPQTGVSVD